MKSFLTPAYVFTPGAAGAGTVDLSAIPGFDSKKLVAIINQTRGVVLYATGNALFKYASVAAGVVTLSVDCSTHLAADNLQVIYEDTSPLVVSPNITRGSGAVDANTLRATLATDGPMVTSIGNVADGAAASDTGNFSILAFIKRSLQNWTTLIARIPGTLGQKTMANSFAVTIASDQGPIPVTESALGITFQEILNLTTVAQTFVAPVGTKWMLIETDDTNGANIRVKIGGAATVASGIQFQPGRSEMIKGGGNISVIAESGVNQKISVQFGA